MYWNLWTLVRNILKIIQQGQVGDEDIIIIPEAYEYGRPQDRYMYNPIVMLDQIMVEVYTQCDIDGCLQTTKNQNLKENENGNVVKE